MRTRSQIATWIQRCSLFVVLPIVIILRALSWGKINADNVICKHDLMTLPFVGRCFFFVIESIPTVFLLMALRYFWYILELYKKGAHFSQEAVSLLKRINICVLVWAIYLLFFDTFASLVISLFRPAGQRYVMVSIDADDIMRFFAVLILFMILRVVQEAHAIKSEQDLVV